MKAAERIMLDSQKLSSCTITQSFNVVLVRIVSQREIISSALTNAQFLFGRIRIAQEVGLFAAKIVQDGPIKRVATTTVFERLSI
jgi:hypothetical protein